MTEIRRKTQTIIGKKIKKAGDQGKLAELAKELDLSEAFLRNVYEKNFKKKTE